MFKSPPKKPGKRQSKSMGMEKPDGPNFGLMPKFKFSKKMDPGGGGGLDVGSSGEDEGTFKLRPSASAHFPNHTQPSTRYRRRTADDFLLFCQFILDYTKYDQMKQQELRRRHSSSPSLGSTGSGNESLPQSSTSGFNDLEEIEDDYDSDNAATENPRSRGGRMQTTPKTKRMTLINKKESQRSRKSLAIQFGDGVGTKSAEDDETGDEEKEDEDEGEDWDQITCYCGRPFAGRPMIECTQCLTWVHLKCAKLTRQRIPETWFCQKCKSTKSGEVKKSTSIRGKRVSNAVTKKMERISLESSTAGSPATPESSKVSGSRKRKLTSRRQKLELSFGDDNDNNDSAFQEGEEHSTKSRRRLLTDPELSKDLTDLA